MPAKELPMSEPYRPSSEKGSETAHVPFCTFGEAAHWLAIPERTIRDWFRGQRGANPVLRMSIPSQEFLSLADLAEAWILAAIRREHGITLQSARRALDWMRKRTGSTHPLSSIPLLTDGASLLVEAFDEYVNASHSGQLEWRALVEPCLRRIERGADGTVVRLFPESRRLQQPDEHPVVIDPRVQFGRPCVAGTGIPTSALFDRWAAGDSLEALASDYGLEVAQVDEALRFEARDVRRNAA